MSEFFVIAGPTASGKTSFALRLARELRGEIINADSVQIYAMLKMLSASPSADELSAAPHHLYNFLPPEESFSCANYASLAADKIKEVTKRGNLPIIVGGTGLYIKTLLFGQNPVPEIGQKFRAQSGAEYDLLGKEEFNKHLLQLGLIKEENAKILDRQRAIRIFEVYLQTGRSLYDFWSQPKIKYLPEDSKFRVIHLAPTRELLYSLCDRRLEEIFKNGGVDEVRDFLKTRSPVPATCNKIIGFNEISSYLKGEIPLGEALKKAQIRTRNYAKRQETWLRHQMRDLQRIEYSSLEEFSRIKVKDLF